MNRNGRDAMAGWSKHEMGLTLIEILIALLIGLFLIGGVLQIFINTRETNRMEEALSRLQENGRFAMDFIGRDIRMAGYSFCPIIDETAPPAFIARTVTVGGVTSTVTTNGVADDPNDPSTQDAPDSITLQWRDGNNCATTLVTRTYSVVNNPANNTRELQRDDDGPGGNPPLPLIQGLENMQILYGVDTTPGSPGRGAPDYYATADVVAAAGQLLNVVSVRVSLLLYSTDTAAVSAPASINYNNEQTRVDRRLRRVFTSTFTLRNRLGVIW